MCSRQCVCFHYQGDVEDIAKEKCRIAADQVKGPGNDGVGLVNPYLIA